MERNLVIKRLQKENKEMLKVLKETVELLQIDGINSKKEAIDKIENYFKESQRLLTLEVNIGTVYEIPFTGEDKSYFEPDETWIVEEKFKSLEEAKAFISKQFYIYDIRKVGNKVIALVY